VGPSASFVTRVGPARAGGDDLEHRQGVGRREAVQPLVGAGMQDDEVGPPDRRGRSGVDEHLDVGDQQGVRRELLSTHSTSSARRLVPSSSASHSVRSSR